MSEPYSSASLGATPKAKGVHFSLFFPGKEVFLIIRPQGDARLEREIPLPESYCKCGIWNIYVEGIGAGAHYGYRVDGKWVVDPYALELTTPKQWGDQRKRIYGVVVQEAPFDWEGVERPGHCFDSLFIYEMHVRGFTEHASSKVEKPGTFAGLIEKIPHLKNLGITAVELMPVFSFNETEGPTTALGNYWGYSSESFFALMCPYGSKREFQEMVKAFHRAEIEVILDVVYNHVGSDWLQSLAKSSYFITCEHEHTNYTGCGNTLSTNNPHTMSLILSSLRYFAQEMRVDGFRFDLASIFCRGKSAELLEDPPILRAICEDPAFDSLKLIVEPWDCGGLYQVGTFPHTERFVQWDGQFRDHVRRFFKGSDSSAGPFASAVAGAAQFSSVQFITTHDGLTLQDLVTYSRKYNGQNGERGRDGVDCNESWNCGTEGPSEHPAILSLRTRQIKNFILALCFSAGTPMMLMGDEYGHSRKGNNNAYCQDNDLNYFLWDELENNRWIFDFFKKCIALRKEIHLLNHSRCLIDKSVTWHLPDWGTKSRLVSYTIHDVQRDFFLAFNAGDSPLALPLPKPGRSARWQCLIDTSKGLSDPQSTGETVALEPHSSVLLLC